MTNTVRTEASRIALVVDETRTLDVRDLSMIGDRTMDELAHNWDQVTDTTVVPDAATATVSGTVITLQADVTLTFAQAPAVTVRTIVKADDNLCGVGFVNMTHLVLEDA